MSDTLLITQQLREVIKDSNTDMSDIEGLISAFEAKLCLLYVHVVNKEMIIHKLEDIENLNIDGVIIENEQVVDVEQWLLDEIYSSLEQNYLRPHNDALDIVIDNLIN